MRKFVLAIDQGTTGSAAALIDTNTLEFVDHAKTEFKQIYPHPSWVEHDLNDIWKSVAHSIKLLFERNSITANQIDCIGITNQRETTCAFDRLGNPLSNAIVWQDRRTSSRCDQLNASTWKEKIKQITGLPIDAYFSATKIEWLQQNQIKNALFGTVDTYLLYKLTGGKSFKTEASNASRTLLMDLHKQNWHPELLELFKISVSQLPTIEDSFGHFGVTYNSGILPDGIPITGILGDQQAALFGQAGASKGDMKCTYGTGAFLLLNTGDEIQYSKNGLLSTSAYSYKGKKMYALEGSCYIAGAAIQWLRDNLNFFSASDESEALASSCSRSEMESILFLPFFTGIGSPHWKQNARASILGLSRDSNKAHITRAALEGIAFSIKDLINAFGFPISRLKVDGGMVKNKLFLQIQSDALNIPLICPKVTETTSYGAALAAAIGTGLITLPQARSMWKKDFEVTPGSDINYFSTKHQLWTKAVKNIN